MWEKNNSMSPLLSLLDCRDLVTNDHEVSDQPTILGSSLWKGNARDCDP
jgi:hypothetical protein